MPKTTAVIRRGRRPVSLDSFIAKGAPDPVEEPTAFRRWTDEQTKNLILAFEGEAFTKTTIITAMESRAFRVVPHTRNAAYMTLIYKSVRSTLRSRFDVVVGSFGSGINVRGGEPDAYVHVPANGEVAVSYWRRRSDLRLDEARACREKCASDERYARRHKAWWDDVIERRTRGCAV